jgi:hypothetical protein
LLLVGVFCPLLSVPLAGSMSYFSNPNAHSDGIIILALAALAAVCSLVAPGTGDGGRRASLVTVAAGLGSLGLVLFTYATIQQRLSSARADMMRQLDGNPFRGLAELAVNAVHFEWGWAVLLLGAILVVGGAAAGAGVGQRPRVAVLALLAALSSWVIWVN